LVAQLQQRAGKQKTRRSAVLGRRIFLHRVIFATPNGCIIPAQTGVGHMGVIVSILGRGMAIAIAGAGAFVIADYALDWL
jgi:hypothetical protein